MNHPFRVENPMVVANGYCIRLSRYEKAIFSGLKAHGFWIRPNDYEIS